MLKITLSISFFLMISACASQQAKLSSTEQNQSANKVVSAVVTEYRLSEKVLTKPLPSLEICEAVGLPTDPESYLTGWERAASQFELEVPDNRRVKAQRDWYVKHPNYLNRVSKRATPYLYFIIDELEKRDLPLELALLPIVESAYDPFAYSHGRASGMWQFIPGTAKGYGLKQNWWYDGRRDVFLSTHAALDYLSYLNKHFDGNWLHALAAYNSGQGNVRKAIRRNAKEGKPTDFWSLKLPRETKAYVPKLLALADILNTHINQTKAALDLNTASETWFPVANEPYFSRIATNVQIDLSLAAELSEQTMAEFYQLNPAYNRWATAPNGPHYLLFPIEKAEKFSQNLANIPEKERIAFKQYTIKEGDTIGQIAQRFSTSVALLKKTNRLRGNNIRAGKMLLIPVPSKKRIQYSKSNKQRLAAMQSKSRVGNKLSVRVESGDSFWSISRKHKVSTRQLAAWNNMAPTDTLKVGQKLVLWTKQSNYKSASYKSASLMKYNQKTRKIHYKVRSGDSFARIADKFNVSLNKIKTWNSGLSKKKYLQPGQSLTLFVDITNQL